MESAQMLCSLRRERRCLRIGSGMRSKILIVITEFTICLHCLAVLSTLLPALKESFVPAAPSPCLGMCDLRQSNNPRFFHYVTPLWDVITEARCNGQEPDLTELAEYITKYAKLPVCNKSVPAQRACYISTSVLELTVCEECHEEVIVPDRERGVPLAMEFKNVTYGSDGFTCQLCSDRMRSIWKEAADVNSTSMLREKGSERRAKELEIRL
jgi:hypothetical protein